MYAVCLSDSIHINGWKLVKRKWRGHISLLIAKSCFSSSDNCFSFKISVRLRRKKKKENC